MENNTINIKKVSTNKCRHFLIKYYENNIKESQDL